MNTSTHTPIYSMCVLLFCLVEILSIQANFYNELNVSKVCKDDYCFPKVVWAYWDDEGHMPDDIKEMVNISSKSLTNFTYCFLTKDNISKILNVDIFPSGYHELKRLPGKSDYIRVLLLEEYGGIWIDSSTYVNSGSAVELVVSEAIEHKSHIVVFDYKYMDEKINFAFFGAPEKSRIMKGYKKEYEKAFSIGVNRYLKESCDKLQGQLSGNKSHLCTPVFLVHMVYSTMLFDNPSLNDLVLTLPENQGHMRLFGECEHQFSCFAKRFINDTLVREYPIIKMCYNFRRAVKMELSDGPRQEQIKKFVWLLESEAVVTVILMIYVYTHKEKLD